MDLPVLLLKLRDYVFWLGPLYLLSLALDAATTVFVRRLLNLPTPAEAETPAQRRTSAELGVSSALDSSAIILQVAWHRAGRPSGAWRVSTRLYIWAALMSRSASWMALLMTSLLSLPLSVMRVGFGLLLASLLALLAPFLIDRVGVTRSTSSAGRMGTMIVPVQASQTEGRSPGNILREWWQLALARLAATSDTLLIGAGLGATFIALSPNVTSLLKAGLGTPVAELTGTVLGVLAPLLPGTELPLVVAMQSRGVEGRVIAALLLIVTVSNWRLARDLYHQFTLRIAILYIALAGLLVLLLSLFAAPLFRLIGAL